MALLLPFRRGRMQEAHPFPMNQVVGEAGEVLSSLLTACTDAHPHSSEVLVSDPLLDADVEELLTEIKGRKVQLRSPQRGDKVKLIALAMRNAGCLPLESFARCANGQSPGTAARGCASVSSAQSHRMLRPITFRKRSCGQPGCVLGGCAARKRYRRYRVRSVQGPDDYAPCEKSLNDESTGSERGRKARRCPS